MRYSAVAVACILIGLSGCADHVHDSDQSEGWAYRKGGALELIVRPHAPVEAGEGGENGEPGGEPVVGTWTGEGTFAQPPVYSQRYYVLEIRNDRIGGMSRRTEVRGLDEVSGLPAAADEFEERGISMRLERDAGVLVLEGEKEGKKARGEVRFEKNEEYELLVSALAGRSVGVGELAALAYANVRRSDVEALRAAGQRLSVSELIGLRDRGVSGEYLRELGETGREFSLEEAVELKSAGVRASYVRELGEVGMTPSVDELVRLKRNGVTSAFVAGLRGGDGSERSGGLPRTEEIIRLRNSGVSSTFVGELRRAGYNLSAEEVLRLSRSSVSATYARGIKEAGYDLSVDQLIKLRSSGVSVQYVEDLMEPGYERMSLEQIMEAKKKGLSAEFVKGLRRRG